MRHNFGAAASLKNARAMPRTFDKSHEIAACGVCGSRLTFSTGEFGQSLEACLNDRCVNHTPHRLQPDLQQHHKPKRQRTSKALRGPSR